MSITFFPCPYDGPPPKDAPDVNMSNRNAGMVIRSLYPDGTPGRSFEQYGCGNLDADDLLSRCTVARAVPPVEDDGQPDIEAPRQPGMARMIDCGLPAGYFADKYAALAEVAEYAKKHNLPIVYS